MLSLVTGGAGFIGSHLTEALVARGDRVTVIDDESTGDPANLASFAGHPRFRYVKGTVADEELMRQLLDGVQEVYHLAAAVGVGLIASNPIQTIETNIYPTQRLLAELRRLHAAGKPVKMFLASSSEVYGKNPLPRWTEEDDLVFGPTTRPRWSYGVSKAIDEFLALACWRQERLPVVVGRLFNVVGPRQTGRYGMVLPRLVFAALAGRRPIVHDDGAQERCFAHVNDVVRAILALMQSPAASGGVFNIGSDQPVSIRELARRVIAAVNPALEIEFQSYAAAYSEDFEDIRRRVPDLSRLRRTIDFQLQYDLERIIAEVIAWQRQVGTNDRKS
ncbi:MAG TPA: GDP-mannose 4,6-dehydratase [Pirellulales bacterium]|jgi:UDP-glucose 4-epimerase|nr:GDP-mannose 4,6-dehydratase [Pirellulales bacterium]